MYSNLYIYTRKKIHRYRVHKNGTKYEPAIQNIHVYKIFIVGIVKL